MPFAFNLFVWFADLNDDAGVSGEIKQVQVYDKSRYSNRSTVVLRLGQPVKQV